MFCEILVVVNNSEQLVLKFELKIWKIMRLRVRTFCKISICVVYFRFDLMAEFSHFAIVVASRDQRPFKWIRLAKELEPS